MKLKFFIIILIFSTISFAKHGNVKLEQINEKTNIVIVDNIGNDFRNIDLELEDSFLLYVEKIIQAKILDKNELLLMAKIFEKNIPEKYIEELKLISEQSGIDYNELLLGNCILDFMKSYIGCTTLINLRKNKENEIQFGRNVDFISFDILDKYSFVLVNNQEGIIPYSAITWPGLIGVISGINKNGLCITVNEVYTGEFNNDATPYPIIIREILENAANIEEAEKIISNSKFSSTLNLTLTDKTQAVVFEISPNGYKKINPIQNYLYATNNFKNKVEKLKTAREVYLEELVENEKVEINDLKKALKNTELSYYVQSIIFYPEKVEMEVKINGSTEYTKIKINEYFR